MYSYFIIWLSEALESFQGNEQYFFYIFRMVSPVTVNVLPCDEKIKLKQCNELSDDLFKDWISAIRRNDVDFVNERLESAYAEDRDRLLNGFIIWNLKDDSGGKQRKKGSHKLFIFNTFIFVKRNRAHIICKK